MRTLHVVRTIDLEGSGLTHSVLGLCRSLRELDHEVRVHALALGRQGEPPVEVEVIAHRPARLGAEKLGWSWAMWRALREDARSADILHVHSLWNMPTVYGAFAVRGTRCRLVCSPRGTLAPHAFRWRGGRKRLFWLCGQRETVVGAACLHATAGSELSDLRAHGLRQPVAVIPNAVELPPEAPRPPPGERRRLVFLGRVHPIKGLDILLDAWRRVQARFPEWELDILGPPEDGHELELAARIRALGCERVTLGGARYGAAKWAAYRAADLFVLPSRSENFGNSVVEALACGTPAIVSDGAPWSGLAREGCGWWYPQGAGPLAETLGEALARPPGALAEMGRRGRAWVQRDFSWQRVGSMMQRTYEWVLGGGSPPEWIDTDDRHAGRSHVPAHPRVSGDLRLPVPSFR